MKKILVVGSIAYDRIMNFPGLYKDNFVPDKLHNINVSFFIDDLKERFGGTGANVAFNLAQLGLTPTLIGNAGSDFGPYREWLDSKGIDTSAIRQLDQYKTGVSTMMTDQAHNQITSFYPGAMSEPHELTPELLQDVEIAIISPTNPDDMKTYPKIFRDNDIPYIFDPSQQLPMFDKDELIDCIKGSYALTCNDYEMNIIKKRTDLFEKELLELTNMVVVTLGAEGSEIHLKDQTIKAEAITIPQEQVVDPTGAGDAYRAGMIYGIIQQWDLKSIAQFAGTVASYAIGHHGTQAHSFTMAEVQQRYSDTFGPDQVTG